MHLFVDYVQPLTDWLHVNPGWALFITFLISAAESLAIIGSIIPGSLTMTAIGILAGSGILRIDLTLLSASLGAMAGDSASYMLGYVFSDKMAHIWPFNYYPNLLRYGKEFFNKHGGKSVLIGRFVGPLRSIIPLIAGMMHMQRIHFFVANLFSAIGWSLLYVLPGYLIGMAGSHLSTESATHLFGFIIMMLIIVWIASAGIRYLARGINRWYNGHLDTLYRGYTNCAYLKHLFREPDQENSQFNKLTITLVLLWFTCFIISILMITLVMLNSPLVELNSPISFFLQSLRTNLLDDFFILLNFIVSPLSIGGVFLFFCTVALYTKDWRIFRYLISLVAVTFVTTWILRSAIPIDNPADLFKLTADADFPDIHLTWATVLFTFIICYLIDYYRNEFSAWLRTLLIAILIIAGFATVYLGDNWISSVLAAYFIGISISLIHWIFYRRSQTQHHRTGRIILLTSVILFITTTINYVLNYQQIVINHAPKHHQYVLSEEDWWHQSVPVLPLYTTNRIGQNTGLFNIQYAGSIRYLEKQLKKHGWQKQSGALFSLMIIVGGEHDAQGLPLMQQLYLNKKPVLIMTYKTSRNNFYLLRLWRSNYRITHYPEPIWLGSVLLVRKKTNSVKLGQKPTPATNLFTPLFPAIKNYRITNINKQDRHVTSLRYVIPPEILIIKEPL